MSTRNTRAAKAARRKDRARRRLAAGESLADFHTLDELIGLAERGARLSCGCDAHQLLHEFLADADAEGPGIAPGPG